MKVFVINLRKNSERMEKISNRLSQLGVPFERVEAVYGRDLSPAEKHEKTDFFHWWCMKGYHPRDGELGAALSHQLIYRVMIEQNIPVACVFEDDANPNENLPEQMVRVERYADVLKPQVYLIADHTEVRRDDWTIRRIGGGAFAEGYILTKAAADALLKDNFPVKTPADSWSYWARKGITELYQTTPAACDQAWEEEGYRSDVTPDNTAVADVRRMSFLQKMCWKVNRLAGKVLGKVIYHD